jgi:penicillin-binding protein 2
MKNWKKQTPFVVPKIFIVDKDLARLEQMRYVENISPLENNDKDFLKNIIIPRHFKILFFLFVLIMFVFLGRSVDLQIIRHSQFSFLAEKNRIRLIKIPAERGLIKDRNDFILAGNRPQFIVTLTPADLPAEKNKRESLFNEIGHLINLSPQEIKEKIESSKKFFSPYDHILLVDNLDYEKALLLLIKSQSIPGLNIELITRRTYFNPHLDNQIFSHLIGYVGYLSPEEFEKNKKNYSFDDIIGKTGIELVYENWLKGKNGKRKIEVDALGKTINILTEDSPEPGENLVLTIDGELQKKAYESLVHQLKKLGLQRGVVIVLNPQNGEILALVSVPSYDNEKFIGRLPKEEYQALINNSNQPLFNRAIAGEYPPGSTFKPVLAAAGLNEGLISEKTTILSTGGLRVGRWFFPDWKVGGHGVTNVRRAIAESINTFFYYLGGGYKDFSGLGLDKILSYARLFGFGQKTLVDLPNEKDGFLPTAEWKRKKINEDWYIGDTYHLSIGQGYILVTPLQITQAMAVFANGGKLLRPHLLYAKENPLNGEKEYQKPEMIRQNFISESALITVRAGLRDAVKYGSARQLSSLPFSVAGKTGTAQGNEKRKPHAWFTGFAPFENPAIVVTVLIEEGGEGSAVAVPVAREIMEWWFKNRFNPRIKNDEH